jgi:hypothetical protein
MPVQKEIVKELAGPCPYLLPASSKDASGSSSLNTSWSQSAASDSLIVSILSLRLQTAQTAIKSA